MQLKFRPHFEQFDARDLPSGTPLDPPDTSALDQALLQSLYVDGQLSTEDLQSLLGLSFDGTAPPPEDSTDAFTAQLDGTLADDELTLTELESLLGTDLDGSDNPNPADPPPPQPAPQPPAAPAPFSPVPPLNDPAVQVVVMPNLDFTNVGGGKATVAEAAEARTVLQQVKAIDIGIDTIKAKKAVLTGVLEGKNGDFKRLEKLAFEKLAAYDAAAAALRDLNVGDPGYQQARDAANGAAGQLRGVEQAATLIAAERENVLGRIAYLQTKIEELVKLKDRLKRRVDIIILNLQNGTPVGPPLAYTLPSFIDWNSLAWTDYTKPMNSLRATATGQ